MWWIRPRSSAFSIWLVRLWYSFSDDFYYYSFLSFILYFLFYYFLFIFHQFLLFIEFILFMCWF
jgi:hypothetical protein